MPRKSRDAISASLRFEIFKRDGFACCYCGRSSPRRSIEGARVVLHVDHVEPLAAGGLTTPENLVTACSDCNLGKGSISLEASLLSRGPIRRVASSVLAAYVRQKLSGHSIDIDWARALEEARLPLRLELLPFGELFEAIDEVLEAPNPATEAGDDLEVMIAGQIEDAVYDRLAAKAA